MTELTKPPIKGRSEKQRYYVIPSDGCTNGDTRQYLLQLDKNTALDVFLWERVTSHVEFSHSSPTWEEFAVKYYDLLLKRNDVTQEEANEKSSYLNAFIIVGEHFYDNFVKDIGDLIHDDKCLEHVNRLMTRLVNTHMLAYVYR